MTNLEVAIAEPGNNMTPNEAQLQWLDNYINNTLLPAWYAEHPDLAPVTDQDSDGVPDDIEAELGTNPNNPDTDGDGLTDGEEIYQPDGTTIKTGHELDTDGDGIIDALEPNTDLDGDGQSAATGDTNDQDPCIPDTHSAPCQATTATADTTDNTPSQHAWTSLMGDLGFEVLSDFWPHGKTSSAYGVLRSDGTTERALFVIDKQGVIRWIDVHDINERPPLEELAAALAKIDG